MSGPRVSRGCEGGEDVEEVDFNVVRRAHGCDDGLRVYSKSPQLPLMLEVKACFFFSLGGATVPISTGRTSPIV